jgi:predicted ATPase/DNA-binding winged helix-turn-helix (wHTH) protein
VWTTPPHVAPRVALKPAARELLVDGVPARLGARAFDVLSALVEAGGGVVSHDTLLQRAWPDKAVLADNLKITIIALRRLLGRDAVVTVPRRGYRLGVALVRRDTPAAPPSPVGGMLLGRDDDLGRLEGLLQRARLVTVCGAGGIGKTRLAAALAARSNRRDGHALVELAALTDARPLVATIARALALPPTDSEAALFTALQPLSMLLVLDNAEHLLDPVVTLVRSLIAAAPAVSVLVTSREPLRLPQEEVLRLEGLACPETDDLATVRAAPAAALLVARAQAADTSFTLDESGAGAVAEVCRQLGGVPLALELAAARVALLGTAGVLALLRAPLSLLTRGRTGAPPRHMTLRATLQWSHDLLDEPQQAALRRLAVFADSFTIDAACAVLCSAALQPAFGDAEARLALQALVDKSLLTAVDREAARWRLLEPTRVFALERLDASGEAPRLRRRHAETVLAVFDAANQRIDAQGALPWVDALLPDLANLRGALSWAEGPDGDAALAVGLCGVAGMFWAQAGLDADAGPPLRRLMPRLTEAMPARQRGWFWHAIALRHADSRFTWAETDAASERAVELARAAGDGWLLYRALAVRPQLAQRAHGFGFVDAAAIAAEMRSLEGDDWPDTRRRARRWCENFAIFQRGDWPTFCESQRAEYHRDLAAGDLLNSWVSAHRLALAEIACARAPDAVAVMADAVQAIRQHGLQRRCWQQVAMLAMAHIESGDAPAQAVHEAVRLMRGAGAMMWMVCHLAQWLAQQQRWADAARLLGWAHKRYAERGEEPSGHGRAARTRVEQALAAAASPAEVLAWRAQGEDWHDDLVAAVLLAHGT